MSDLEVREGADRARSNDHLRVGHRVRAGDTLIGTATGARVMAQRMLIRFVYLRRPNRNETLAEFCRRVDERQGFTGKVWDAATKRVTGAETPMQEIGSDDLRKVCRYFAFAIRSTPTQTDDAPWYPDGWSEAVDAFSDKAPQ